MKIILKKEVENIGQKGDVKEVANGFARNFLLPNGLAEIATDKNIAKIEKEKERKVEKEKDDLKEMQKLASELDGREVSVLKKTEKEKLFGSVSTHDISQAMASQGTKLDEKYIVLDSPIKEIGEHPIKIRLDHGIEVEIKVIVEAD